MFFPDFLRIWGMDDLFCPGRGKNKKAGPVLKNNLSWGEKDLSGSLWGSIKTKFASLNNGSIKENQEKMSKISVKK